MKMLVSLLVVVLLAGCSAGPNSQVVDQCIRQQLFQQCMSELPAGPVVTHYNDWDDVVNACNTTAYNMSLRLNSQVQPACSEGDWRRM